MSERNGNQNTNRGTVVSIRGSVVDAHFPNRLPARYHVLHTGDAQRIVIEVIVHNSNWRLAFFGGYKFE